MSFLGKTEILNLNLQTEHLVTLINPHFSFRS